ncbi:unnamed protein product, partial [Prorocentrum cordatum]
ASAPDAGGVGAAAASAGLLQVERLLRGARGQLRRGLGAPAPGSAAMRLVLGGALCLFAVVMVLFCARRLCQFSQPEPEGAQHDRRKVRGQVLEAAAAVRSDRAQPASRRATSHKVSFQNFAGGVNRASSARQAVAALGRQKSSRPRPQADPDAVRYNIGSRPGSAASVHVVAQGTTAHWQSEPSPRYVRQTSTRRSLAGSGGDAVRPLPPLCPGSVPPPHETRFSVPVDTLAVAGDNDLSGVALEVLLAR